MIDLFSFSGLLQVIGTLGALVLFVLGIRGVVPILRERDKKQIEKNKDKINELMISCNDSTLKTVLNELSDEYDPYPGSKCKNRKTNKDIGKELVSLEENMIYAQYKYHTKIDPIIKRIKALFVRLGLK